MFDCCLDIHKLYSYSKSIYCYSLYKSCTSIANFPWQSNHMDKFMNILKDGRLELSNNRAERAVKEIVMGRKNWLFSQSSTGGKAMAIIIEYTRNRQAK